jgi:pentose-5-phosphate-3-epimerase
VTESGVFRADDAGVGAAGANAIAAGSVIFTAPDYAHAIAAPRQARE